MASILQTYVGSWATERSVSSLPRTGLDCIDGVWRKELIYGDAVRVPESSVDRDISRLLQTAFRAPQTPDCSTPSRNDDLVVENAIAIHPVINSESVRAYVRTTIASLTQIQNQTQGDLTHTHTRTTLRHSNRRTQLQRAGAGRRSRSRCRS